MKKRIFILLSSILCSLVTISLVTYTIVDGIAKRPVNPSNPEDPKNEVNIDKDPEILHSNLTLNLVVGDEYAGDVLTVSNYNGSLLVAGENGKLVATNEGSEDISVLSGSTIYACNVNVFSKGDGSVENPYSIVRASDLISLVNENRDNYAYYSQKCDLDLSSFESWAPIGSVANPFVGSYNGNGYAIKNMKIQLTAENVENYIEVAQTNGGANGRMLTVGFFGFVGNPSREETTNEIKNVNIVNANIDTTAVETDAVRTTLKLGQSYIGTLAGVVSNTEISGENSKVVTKINASLANDATSTCGVVAGLVGRTNNSSISGFDVDATIVAKNPGFVSETESGYVYSGSIIAGLVGRAYNTNMDGMTVRLNVQAKNYKNTVIAGAVGYVVDGTNATEMTIKNINIESMVVDLANYSFTSNNAGLVSGAVSAIYNKKCTLENVNVNNIVVNATYTGRVSGLVDYNEGTILNSSVNGLLKGAYVAGLVYNNQGTVKFDTNFANEYAVDVNLKAMMYAGGIAVENYGTIEGSENLTKVKAIIGWTPVNKTNFDAYADEIMLAGAVTFNNGTIKNIYSISSIVDAVNASGFVGTMENGVIDNCVVNTSIRTLNNGQSKHYSGKTNIVSGVVAIVNGTTNKINNVSGNVTINNTNVINTNKNYSLNIFGTIVGKLNGNVEISSDNAEDDIQVKFYADLASAGTQTVGYLVGKVESGKVTIGEKVMVRIAIIKTAENAVINK